MTEGKKKFFIAEIGCNHMGDIEIAKKMIKTAQEFCHVSAVKFQKRTNKELLTPQEYALPHPNPQNAFGASYGAHREFLEFSIDQHKILQNYCKSLGIIYSSSVWDITAAKEIAGLNPYFIKIPSASNLDFEMLDWLCNHFHGEIHLSLGMTRIQEEENIVTFFINKKRNKDLVLYSCTSGYPVPFEDICLLEISRLKEKFGKQVKGIGFSGHHAGIAADIAALALGATYFERHFTLDRTWKGTDQAASLEPDGLRKLVRDLQNVSLALHYKKEEILDIEKVQRKKLKRKIAS